MNAREINEKLLQLQGAAAQLEAEYEENGGEVTESTEAKEGFIRCVSELLMNEGVDSIGRWLKSLEDAKKALKAERDYLARRISGIDGTMEYAKAVAANVLRTAGVEKVKGSNGYSFSRYVSDTVKPNAPLLRERYQEQANAAVHAAGIPEWVTVTVGASSTLVPAGTELPDVFDRKTVETVRFTKPRASAE